MEIKAAIEKPCTDEERADFIVVQNHQKGYIIEETDEVIEAWGQTSEELLADKKAAKQQENTEKAKLAVENGHVVFKNAEFETNAQTVGDLTATMLLMQAGGVESYLWLSKDDQTVALTVEDFGTLGGLIATYKNTIWQEKYITYKAQIEQADTVDAVNAIVLDYTDEVAE